MPVSQFIFHKPFCLQQPQALCGACSLTVVFSPFLFLFPHKQEEESLPQKQSVLHSNRLGARGKYPPGRFSDGETPEGAEGEGVGDDVRPAPHPTPVPRASISPFASALSPTTPVSTHRLIPAKDTLKEEARLRPEKWREDQCGQCCSGRRTVGELKTEFNGVYFKGLMVLIHESGTSSPSR